MYIDPNKLFIIHLAFSSPENQTHKKIHLSLILERVMNNLHDHLSFIGSTKGNSTPINCTVISIICEVIFSVQAPQKGKKTNQPYGDTNNLCGHIYFTCITKGNNTSTISMNIDQGKQTKTLRSFHMGENE